MTRDPKMPRMNGVECRLEYIQEEIERAVLEIRDVVGSVRMDIGKRLMVVGNDLSRLMDRVADARQLAQPECWRLMMSVDTALAKEFIRVIEPEVLAEAVAESEEGDLVKFVEAIEARW